MKKAVLFFAAIIAVVALTSSKLPTTSNETKAPTSSEITSCGWHEIIAYSGKQESAYFYSNCDYVGKTKDQSYRISKNPYHNSEMCSPGKAWCTCFEFCFNCDGKTYYFND